MRAEPRTGLNVTVDPSSRAEAVDDPQIAEVIDLVSGEIRETTGLIGGLRYGELIAERVRIKERLADERPAYACAICATPVYLVASLRKRFFFRHIHEDGSCRARTRGELTEAQIRARKYHGLRESDAHRRIKSLIERSLRADPRFALESILTESRWAASGDPTQWRQPDVQARLSDGQRLAFEAQLSTTFLDVVVARRLFYRDEEAVLVWVLGRFTPEYRRMTTDDLLFSNNSNVFVVDEETVALSEERKQFYLRCHYRHAARHGDAIGEEWKEALVPFRDLVRDVEGQRIYYFDYDGQRQQLVAACDQELRDRFIAFWRQTMVPHFEATAENIACWLDLKQRFLPHGIALPESPSRDSSFRSLVHGVLSAATGKPVGWQFDTLIQVAHQLAQAHTENLLAFGYALECSGHKAVFDGQDVTGKWRRKRQEFAPRIRARDPLYMPNAEWLPFLLFAFPEIGARVQSFVQRD